MKIEMSCTTNVRVLTKSANEWNMNDRHGISYKVGIRSGDDIDKVKVTKDLYDQLQVDHDYLLVGSLNISNGNTNFMFDSVRLDATTGKSPDQAMFNKPAK